MLCILVFDPISFVYGAGYCVLFIMLPHNTAGWWVFGLMMWMGGAAKWRHLIRRKATLSQPRDFYWCWRLPLICRPNDLFSHWCAAQFLPGQMCLFARAQSNLNFSSHSGLSHLPYRKTYSCGFSQGIGKNPHFNNDDMMIDRYSYSYYSYYWFIIAGIYKVSDVSQVNS